MTTTRSHSRWPVWGLLSTLVLACGGAAERGSSGSAGMAGAAGSATAGAAGASSSGTAGQGPAGAAGTGGTLSGRACGSGAPCGDGATCRYFGIESGATCECDPSGHFFCEASASGGAGPFENCNESTVCAGAAGAGAAPPATCSQTNGYCTRTCTCGSGCEMTCDGAGGANAGDAFTCDETYCEIEYWGFGACEIRDGACDYEVACGFDQIPEVAGTCE